MSERTNDTQTKADHGLPQAQLPSRRPGTLRGKIWMAPDFDTLPTDILAAMERDEV